MQLEILQTNTSRFPIETVYEIVSDPQWGHLLVEVILLSACTAQHWNDRLVEANQRLQNSLHLHTWTSRHLKIVLSISHREILSELFIEGSEFEAVGDDAFEEGEFIATLLILSIGSQLQDEFEQFGIVELSLSVGLFVVVSRKLQADYLHQQPNHIQFGCKVFRLQANYAGLVDVLDVYVLENRFEKGEGQPMLGHQEMPEHKFEDILAQQTLFDLSLYHLYAVQHPLPPFLFEEARTKLDVLNGIRSENLFAIAGQKCEELIHGFLEVGDQIQALPKDIQSQLVPEDFVNELTDEAHPEYFEIHIKVLRFGASQMLLKALQEAFVVTVFESSLACFFELSHP